MSSEYDIISAIIENLRSLTGLHPELGPHARFQTPALLPMIGAEHNSAWGELEGPLTGSLYVLVKYGATGSDGYRLVYDYTSPVGSQSITQLLMDSHLTDANGVVRALPTVAQPEGVVNGVRVGRALVPKLYTFGDGAVFWGRELPVKIWPRPYEGV